MLTEDTNRGAHQEPYAGQNSVSSPPQDPSISFAFNPSLKSADDARSSISSDKSDSKPPRSAMRRTSSISKLPLSPRRVRFDFMGEEVLPTSSPQHTAFIAARISSPVPADPTGSSDPAFPESSFTSNLATDPGEDEGEVPPRKVSSSDALRALSRAPRDEDGTVWTVVNSDSEDSGADEVQLTQSHQPERPDEPLTNSAAPTSPGPEGRVTTPTTPMGYKTNISNMTTHNSNTPEDDSSDDEDILSMAKRRAPPPCASREPSPQGPPTSGKEDVLSAASGQNTRPSNSEQADLACGETIRNEGPASDDSEEDLFYFEPDGIEGGPKSIPRGTKHEPRKQEEESESASESGEDDSEDEIDTEALPSTNVYATSLPVEIPIPEMREDPQAPPGSQPIKLRMHSGMVGSYKGRPLVIPILRNDEILDEIRSSVPIRPIVGSVHDRSPADDLNVSAMQGSIEERLAEAASTARSFKERLIIEEMMDSMKKTRRKPGRQ
ncbi:hypothetical protein E4U42_001653 [Claviceps africana]|uniref:Uncharacterized protein n=1 Tax=Claviceps africana TaxID=83212 RepID=A0A8K0NLX1_9HYPO|nr:hypothetical protein E4U42_001653 [Claviceps africana]